MHNLQYGIQQFIIALFKSTVLNGCTKYGNNNTINSISYLSVQNLLHKG